MKTLDYSSSKVSPVISVIKPILAAQGNNAATLHRFSEALRRYLIPSEKEDFEIDGRRFGYVKLRQSVSETETFSFFIRSLAKEFMA